MPDEAVSLFIALYLDADVSRYLAQLLRQHGFDALSAWELGQQAWSDADQLAYAAETRRAILTYNKGDFARLAQAYAEARREHYGIIVSEQLPLGELVRRTLHLLDRVTADEMRNSFQYLSDFAHRQ